MALTRWQSTIVDETGNIQPFAELVILNEDTQGNAAVYHDREGNSQVSGAVVADEDGFAYFYAKGGLYRIQSAGLDIDWRHVPIGNMQEVDRDQIADLSTYTELTSAEDLDNIKVPGVYCWDASMPTGSPEDELYCVMVVYIKPETTQPYDHNVVQIVYRVNSKRSYLRTFGGNDPGSWEDWERQFVASGSTNAGSWTQYPDGTMECTHESTFPIRWIYPKQFYGEKPLIMTGSRATNAGNPRLICVLDGETYNATECTLGNYNGWTSSDTDSKIGSFTAKGRWK